MATISTNDIKIRYDIDLSKLQQATSEFDRITAEERQLLAELGKLKKQLDDVGDKAKKAGKDTGDAFGGMGAVAAKVGPVIAGIFAADRVMGFAKEVIAVTAEFQKLSAVLINTLGSRSAAAGAMTNIQKFASETPFSVQELTASFVKLANQGFTPTTQQLRKLGDLASSTGKGFDQLAEAIIDAQTGEFERLKEFGIRASKAGDQVTFTFKGVQTQVKFTNDAIRQYLVSLGEVQGVSGAMAAISGTLGGQISNLGDAYDSLLNTIGTNLAPIYQKALGATSLFLTKLNDLFGGKQVKEAGEAYNKIYERFSNASPEALANLKINTAAQVKSLKERVEALKKVYGDETRQADVIREEYRAAGSEYDEIQQQTITTSRTVTAAQISDLEKLLKAYELNLDVFNKLSDDKKKVTEADKEKAKRDKEEYERRLKLLQLEKELSSIINKIRYDNKIDLLREEFKAENKFLKDVYKLQVQYAALGVKAAKDGIEKTRLEKELNRVQTIRDLKSETQDVLDAIKKQREENAKFEAEKTKAQEERTSKRQKVNFEIEQLEIDLQEIELAQTLSDGAFGLFKARINNEMALNDKRYEQEIRLADGNQQKIDEINQRREQKERELKMKAWKAEQTAAVARVIFETASIVAKWSSNPVTLPLAALTLFNQAAQIGFIMAQPVPEFAEGTKGKPFKGGKAIVGERGVEKVVTESGKVYFTPASATLVDLPKGSQVIPNHALSRQELFLANHYANRNSSSGSPVVGKLDELGSILKSLPITQLSMDEKGFEKFIRTPRRTTKILNNRFRSDS
jgi:hypothetical protein